MARTLIALDGMSIEQEESPDSAAHLSDILRRAWEANAAVIPIGGGTKLHIGNRPRAGNLALHLSRLRGIVQYEPDNMTVSVLPGTPLQELQQILAGHKQFLPLDPPHPEHATVGGLVACNTSGPIRFRYGTIRDLLIGVKIVHADGTQTKAGGKLVKNVTGYDMCKLYTGSLGTLGVLSELTFKLQPKSEALGTALLSYPSLQSALEACQRFLRSDLLPDALEAWNSEAAAGVSAPCSNWLLIVRFGEVAPAVAWQLKRLEELVQGTDGQWIRTLDGPGSEEFWDKAASYRDVPVSSGDVVLIKCSVLYQSAASTAQLADDLGRHLGARTFIHCHAGNYVLYCRYEWEAKAPASGVLHAGLTKLRQHCLSAPGHAVIERMPPEAKPGFDVWGYDAPALAIMRRIKEQFDPRCLLNPGRFVGGI